MKKTKLNVDEIARGLGAERRGEVAARGGYFGAIAVAQEIGARFKTPAAGGRSTDPAWTDRRLVALAPKTLRRLQHLAKVVSKKGKVTVSPLQVAALLLERAAEETDEPTVERLTRKRAS